MAYFLKKFESNISHFPNVDHYDYLLVVFESENTPKYSSRICVYSINTIQKQFYHNEVKNIPMKNKTNGNNNFQNGFITNDPLIKLNHKVTSIIADWINDNLVIILGTDQTTILKYALKLPVNPTTTFTEIILFEKLNLIQLDLSNQLPLLSDMFVMKNFLFVMTWKKVNQKLTLIFT